MTETWKSINLNNYPIKLKDNKDWQNQPDMQLRPSSMRQFDESSRTLIGETSFCTSTAKIWNHTPQKIKDAKTLPIAKKAIKNYCKTLTI